jgi:hypothetical protein
MSQLSHQQSKVLRHEPKPEPSVPRTVTWLARCHAPSHLGWPAHRPVVQNWYKPVDVSCWPSESPRVARDVSSRALFGCWSSSGSARSGPAMSEPTKPLGLAVKLGGARETQCGGRVIASTDVERPQLGGPMKNLSTTIATCDDQADAEKDWTAVESAARSGSIDLADAAIVRRETDGTLTTIHRQSRSSSTWAGPSCPAPSTSAEFVRLAPRHGCLTRRRPDA